MTNWWKSYISLSEAVAPAPSANQRVESSGGRGDQKQWPWRACWFTDCWPSWLLLRWWLCSPAVALASLFFFYTEPHSPSSPSRFFFDLLSPSVLVLHPSLYFFAHKKIASCVNASTSCLYHPPGILPVLFITPTVNLFSSLVLFFWGGLCCCFFIDDCVL